MRSRAKNVSLLSNSETMTDSSRKLILLSNDDGYRAPGINRLIEWLRPLADIVVVAPDSGRSGAACSITSTVPITASLVRREQGLEVYACSGTPTDCVKLGLHDLVPRVPDLVVSGINHGDNASINVHYSGTLGAAIEGALHHIKAVAFSSQSHDPLTDLSPLRPYVVSIARAALQNAMPLYTLLNVNFPNLPEFKGVRICRMGRSRWLNEFRKCNLEERGTFYFLTGNWSDTEPQATDTDSHALHEGFVAVTPTTIDVTAQNLIDEVKNWGIEQ